MLCEDRGIFLEIADFIKGLGLTILRGVMEARKNKIWARFTVEVSSSVAKNITSFAENSQANISFPSEHVAIFSFFMDLISCCFLCCLPFGSSSYFLVFIQANRDVTRMEIFLSLMRLLEPSCDGGGAGENPNNVKMPLGVVQYPVIPATGHLR